jgi:hypothetical protein
LTQHRSESDEDDLVDVSHEFAAFATHHQPLFPFSLTLPLKPYTMTFIMNLVYSALGLAFLWLAVLSFFLFRAVNHYKKLSTRTGSKSIDGILDDILDQHVAHNRDMSNLKDALLTLESQAKKHLQRVGFVRFNPFERSGGEQSFVIALLDSNNSGIVKTFMYTREGVRIYVKQVKEGKALEYELSDEEKEAIRLAQ